jgi:chromosome partitioning protein
MGDILRAGLDGSISMADVVWQISRHFDLAPSGIELAGVEQQLATAPDRDRRLVQVLSTVQDKYDFVIIDCPPSIGLLTFNALRAADEVLVPVETGYFSLQGSIKQHQTIEMLARRAGHRVRFKVLATMYDVRTKLAREILSELKKHFGDELLPVVINFNSKLKEAASFGQPITEYDGASRGMQDFERLANWLTANPPVREPQVEVAEEQVTRNPAMSRAAELVERARALSARTAALASRLAADTDARAEGFSPVAPVGVKDDAFEGRPPLNVEEKLARLYGVRQTSQGLLFVFPGAIGRQVAIAGDFNGWDPDRTPMRRDENLGVWQACVNVPPGRYRYRLVLDGEWVQDPYNTYVESNPFGELNNVIEV